MQNSLLLLWKKYFNYILVNRILRLWLVYLLKLYFYFVYFTNIKITASDNYKEIYKKYKSFIITFWHGQHFMGPFLRPRNVKIIAMFSRSKDAELNALFAQKMGLDVVRGSGGRQNSNNRHKGGARALLHLKKNLDKNFVVAMIANISHSSPRQAGKGIVTLAKISSKPIIPYVYLFSREIILKNSWDKASIPLPFGRSVFLCGEPFYVNAQSSAEELAQKAAELTIIMDNLTQKAHELLGKKCHGES